MEEESKREGEGQYVGFGLHSRNSSSSLPRVFPVQINLLQEREVSSSKGLATVYSVARCQVSPLVSTRILYQEGNEPKEGPPSLIFGSFDVCGVGKSEQRTTLNGMG